MDWNIQEGPPRGLATAIALDTTRPPYASPVRALVPGSTSGFPPLAD